MGLGERIGAAIEGSRKSKAQIARECGVTSAAVSQWPTAKSLKAETAIALEVATGYRAAWILSGIGPKLVTDKNPAWPFSVRLLERILALTDQQRGYIEGRLESIVDVAEGDKSRTVGYSVRTEELKAQLERSSGLHRSADEDSQTRPAPRQGRR